MKPTLVRRRAATAGVCLIALAAAAACGPTGTSGKGAEGSVRETPAASGASASTPANSGTPANSSTPAAPGASGTPALPGPSESAPQVEAAGGLTSDQLAAAALATGDVKDFAAESLEGGTPTGSSRTTKAECMPFVSVINGTPEPAPSATVYRRLVDTTEDGKADQTVVTEVLGAHPFGASDVLARLRTAIDACSDGFQTKGGDLEPSVFTEVKELPAPEAGDEAVAYELTGVAQGDPVPMVFQVVRSGTTVVTYYAVDVGGGDTPQIPARLAVAQAAKLKS
uniref:Lipoprotein n=1 Tax=Streptomyces sp. NBC_00003 TaxID=2903608 RepID=A0AAU2V2Y1_9ACTN